MHILIGQISYLSQSLFSDSLPSPPEEFRSRNALEDLAFVLLVVQVLGVDRLGLVERGNRSLNEWIIKNGILF